MSTRTTPPELNGSKPLPDPPELQAWADQAAADLGAWEAPRVEAVDVAGSGWVIRYDTQDPERTSTLLGNSDALRWAWAHRVWHKRFCSCETCVFLFGEEWAKETDAKLAALQEQFAPPPAPLVVILDGDEDTDEHAWPGEWMPDEEGRIWLATGAGESTLLVGLPGSGKSQLAQELAARHREAGGHPLAILPEAANSWKIRNRAYPKGSRVHIVAGVPDLAGLRAALQERLTAGKAWPTMIVIDPVTLAVAEWAGARSDSATYSYPVVSAATTALEAATLSPDGDRPQLVFAVHTPETEQGGRNRRAVGGYTQGAGVAYLLPEVGKVTVLKMPRDCPDDLPTRPMLYALTAGRIVFSGLGTGKGEHRGKRDRKTDRRRIVKVLEDVGEYGATRRQLEQLLPGIGRVTVTSVLAELVDDGIAETFDRGGVTGKPVDHYRLHTGREPAENTPQVIPFRMPDQPPF